MVEVFVREHALTQSMWSRFTDVPFHLAGTACEAHGNAAKAHRLLLPWVRAPEESVARGSAHLAAWDDLCTECGRVYRGEWLVLDPPHTIKS